MSDRSLPGVHEPAGSNKRRWLIALGIFIALVAVIGGCTAIASMNAKPYDANNKVEAISQCEARIADRLKAPSTADFTSDATGYGTWTVTGVVDAENSFGATVRSSFQCTVVIAGDTARTTIDKFD